LSPTSWEDSPEYRRGLDLFHAGYYWEAHEVWEGLWQAHGRRGSVADLLKGLIKLAAAGVKCREGLPQGVRTHARRAADLFDAVRAEVGAVWLGLDLTRLAALARQVAEEPPVDSAPGAPVSRVFPFRLDGSPTREGAPTG
jgi:predicted metal-dependent hydrolase